MGTCLSKKESLNKETSFSLPPPAPAAASSCQKPTTSAGSTSKAIKPTPSTIVAPVEKAAATNSTAREAEKPMKLPLAEISNLTTDNDNKPNNRLLDGASRPAKGQEASMGEENDSGCPPKQNSDADAALKREKGSDDAVRTSSYTKEVDAILIQCGRLSRSSSGKSSNENNAYALTSSAGTNRHSGSKSHFEYQGENENHFNGGDGDDGKGKQRGGRSSHKRIPSGEMGGVVEYYYKRSSSRERNPADQRARRGVAAARVDGGGEARRRVSRSPGKRLEATSNKGRSSPHVSNGSSSSADAGAKPVAKRNNVASRSRSPATRTSTATTPTGATHLIPTMSRSSSKRDEQSPYRRSLPNDSLPESQGHRDNSSNPIATAATIVGDRNKISSSGNHHNALKDGKGETEERIRKPSSHRRTNSLDGSGNVRDSRCCTVPHIREKPPRQLPTTPFLDQRPLQEEAAQVTESPTLDVESCYPQNLVRSMSARRLELESNYPSSLDNDVRSSAFCLPPCISKACSILEAVADLNSNGTGLRARGPLELLELHNHSNDSDHHVTDVNLHNKHVPVREILHQPVSLEGQESSGSNTVVNCTSSWELTSVDSTDRWADRCMFQKFMASEEENSSLSSAYHLQSLPAQILDDVEEAQYGNFKAACTNRLSSEQDKRASRRYDGRVRSENASNTTNCSAGRANANKFFPVKTLSDNMKREDPPRW